MSKFFVRWNRPIHRENPEIQTDRGGQDLPDGSSREEAFATVERWKPWMRANCLFDISLIETDEVGMKMSVEFPIILE